MLKAHRELLATIQQARAQAAKMAEAGAKLMPTQLILRTAEAEISKRIAYYEAQGEKEPAKGARKERVEAAAAATSSN